MLAAVLGQGATAQTPEATDHINVAGLMIDYGDGRVSYALVAFTEESLSGVELLRRSGLPIVTVPFGGLGEGVCSIDAVGCDPGACRRRLCQSADRESPFWQYLRQAEGGSWSPAVLGASHADVDDGDVDAWSWSGTPPDLPPMSVTSMRDLLGVQPGWASGGAGLPDPVTMTQGEPPGGNSDQRSWRDLAPGMALIAGIGMAGWVMIRRTRHRSPAGGR
ncbi:MAG TPA: hypothetical protein VGR08_02725 [Thermomicrobiales bacterium]|nr:hypothetical protein [Thermomicrobiales bacterium]